MKIKLKNILNKTDIFEQLFCTIVLYASFCACSLVYSFFKRKIIGGRAADIIDPRAYRVVVFCSSGLDISFVRSEAFDGEQMKA